MKISIITCTENLPVIISQRHSAAGEPGTAELLFKLAC